ncbi:MAG: hypothetical protein AAF514_14425 [Verrucomicrobiota bacterium]
MKAPLFGCGPAVASWFAPLLLLWPGVSDTRADNLIPNGDFSGGFASWATLGSTDTDTSFTYGAPGAGTISPITGSQVSEIHSSGANAAALAGFLGVTTAAMNNAGGVSHVTADGAAIKTTFWGGGLVSFNWNYWTLDAPPPIPDYNDFSIATISGPGIAGTEVILLADVYGNGLADPTGLGPANGTGWQSLTIPLPGTGNYTIGFASLNPGDRNYDSYLHIDNVRTLPEPGTAFSATFLLAFLLFQRTRRRQR